MNRVPEVAPAGESEAREQYLRALIRVEPGHWRAGVELAQLDQAKGQAREAFEILRASSTKSPGNRIVHLQMNRIAAEADYLDWCLYSRLQVLRKAPEEVSVRLELANLYRRLGWLRDAAAQLAVAETLAPNSQPVLKEQAAFFSKQGQQDDTRRCAMRLIARYPKSPYGYSLIADLAAQSANWKEAVESGRRAVERAQGDPIFAVRQAQYLLTRTDTPQVEEALGVLDEAAKSATEHAAIDYWRGVALRRLDKAPEATEAFERAMNLDPAIESVKLQLGELYRKAGKSSEADRLLAEYKAEQQRAQSAREAATALAVNPLAIENHLRMARAHLDVGAAPEALVEYLTVRRMRPENAEAKRGIEAALAKQSRSIESLAPL